MKSLLTWLMLAAVLASVVGCNTVHSNASNHAFVGMMPEQAVDAYNSGKIRFEVRGLTNNAKTGSGYLGNSTTYEHHATIVAVGDPTFTKKDYWVTFKVKRLSGGDPNQPRKDDLAGVRVVDGIGDLEISGGYRAASERWEPERIELSFYSFSANEVILKEAPISEQ